MDSMGRFCAFNLRWRAFLHLGEHVCAVPFLNFLTRPHSEHDISQYVSMWGYSPVTRVFRSLTCFLRGLPRRLPSVMSHFPVTLSGVPV